ncbi:MAG: hypothetical protein EKK31_06650 [Hyphomicrobiales bacterium]|nr:MAG: hypothetical protein EKK31_06650 [Hyphomicrobiales bacterium]
MKVFVAATTAALLSACSALPNVEAMLAPANSHAPVPVARYVPVLEGTAGYHPVSPKNWVESNDQVAPKEDGK